MAPRIRIPAHVFGYTLATVPAIAYAMYWKKNHKSDEEFEKMLLESSRNKSLIDGSRDKKQNMVSFFDAMKDGDPEQEARMNQVLYGGKGDIKRHYAIDKSLYGTEEGAEQQRMAVEAAAEEQSSRAIKKKRRKKGGKKKKKKMVEDVAKDETKSKTDSIDKVGWNGST
eukprot:CAMPEP_0194117680 /NCGR_PEP_ID=MMETSP0150-20130528/32331_1 /TAXON_ID=122233 /ORGANISM="Chaetoceros debilis, Strain MM31A-1" /LENGTH=168 /DNA_ID=CAMNT_0038808799 /DNA_START=53 /DNA_END=556 /DNA_ORIENTATION=+